MSIEQDGGDLKHFDSALSLASDVEDYAATALRAVSGPSENYVENFLIAMILRCFNFHRGVVGLSRNKLAQPAAVVLRSLVEQSWMVALLAAKDEEADCRQKLVLHAVKERKRSIDRLKRLCDQGMFDRKTFETLVETEPKQGSQWRVEDRAEQAGKSQEYLGAYTVLSYQVHPSIEAVEAHFLFDGSDYPVEVTDTPDLDSLPRNLAFSSEKLLEAVDALPSISEELIARRDAIKAELSKLWVAL